MATRGPLGLPITLGVVMIVLLVLLAVGWVLLAVFGALSDRQMAGVYWVLLSIGSTLFALVLTGTILYLALTVKAIRLTQRQSNFIDSVTHELKSPIASLKLYLQTLTRRQLSPEEQANFYRFMLEDLDRLDQLINQMLDAGRLERQAEAGEFVDIDLPDLIRGCAEEILVRHRAPASTIRLELEPCIVRARRMDLELVFRNLIDNAVKYGGSPPAVDVRLSLSPTGQAMATVADNGRGVPSALRRKIFGRFVRLGNELEREKPGTGLGLYIVRTAVKALRGKVRMRGREPGPGSVFEVILPQCHRPTTGQESAGKGGPVAASIASPPSR